MMDESGSVVAVTVIGGDRPRIVESVTRVLFEAGCNLEDATSTILRGHFAMMLIVKIPTGSKAEDLEQRLSVAGADLGLTVSVRPVDDAALEVTPPSHMLSVYGADHPGIVFRVAEVLANAGFNVTDLTSRVLGPGDQPLYALMMEVAGSDSEGDPTAALEGLKEELGVDITIHPIDADLL
jgi:glycine cleavage system transcriptional repressor